MYDQIGRYIVFISKVTTLNLLNIGKKMDCSSMPVFIVKCSKVGLSPNVCRNTEVLNLMVAVHLKFLILF